MELIPKTASDWFRPLVIHLFASISIFVTPHKAFSQSAIDIPPEILDRSPVLQKWSEEVPNILEDIRHDPSFATRLRLGFTSNGGIRLNMGVEDIFIHRTGLTISGDYDTDFQDSINFGADLHYFLFPLGNYINIAPLVGYRYLQNENYSYDGMNLGIRLMLALSRNGAADISLSQSFVDLGSNKEVGILSFSVGYAITSHTRLSTDIQLQNSPQNQDERIRINWEWLF